MSKTYEGYLLIADITGYTQYLNESELEHAQETLTALLQLLIEQTNPPLVISRLEGDAVISYGLLENFYQGQSFIEKIEDIYVIFRKALDRLVLNNTCQCNACRNISNLDLKFFVHYGTFGIQRISSYDELVGSDINLIHRLVKNSVKEATGFEAYALYTDNAIRQMGIDGVEASMTKHSESYDHLGEVTVWVQDLDPVWERKKSTLEVKLPEGRKWSFDVLLEMPVEAAWDYMTQPENRKLLIGAERVEVIQRSNGRLAEGSIYQCYHGDRLVPQTILEWQPFERMVVSELGPFFPNNPSINEYNLKRVEGGTLLTKTFSEPSGPMFGQIMLKMMMPVFSRMMLGMFDQFKQTVERDYQAHQVTTGQGSDIAEHDIQEAAKASLQHSTG